MPAISLYQILPKLKSIKLIRSLIASLGLILYKIYQANRRDFRLPSKNDKPVIKATLGSDAELTHGEIMVIMSALMLALLLAALDQTIVATALPKIANQLHGLSQYSWVATAY